MLEIFVIWRLIKKNAADGQARGRSGTGAAIYTIAIWFFGEFLGFLIGGSIFRPAGWPFRISILWIGAFLFALLFSQISRAIAKR